MTRRTFIKRAGMAGGAVAALPLFGAEPSRRIVAGVMGLGRGMAHVEALLGIPDVEIGYVCDVDEQRTKAAIDRVAKQQQRPAKGVKDVRQILEDREVDVLTIAAPNHWHAPATILACAAGKHVYVEKPGSHNGREAEMMVMAARKHRRIVQLGTQRRSWPGVREMIERLHGGVIGRVTYARCWYSSARGSIGKGRTAAVPAHLDYSLWQGPAPERPYLDNLVHYNWHWRWHWGGGELANNGVHALDLVTWGLRVTHPRRVVFNGGRYHFDDDQETPDTGAAVFDFGSCGATWDDSSCVPRNQEGLPFVAFYGEGGCIEQDGSGYKVFDEKGQISSTGNGTGGDRVHFENFIGAIRDGGKLNAEIEEGQKAARLCHLGNIAYRKGQGLDVDPSTGRVKADRREEEPLWGREYRRGWEPRV